MGCGDVCLPYGDVHLAFKTPDHKRKPTTVLRTFRFPQSLSSSLEAEAKNRGLSVNALVSSLITKFDNWDRFADRFHFISLTDDLLKAILTHMSDEEIATIAETIGTRVAEEAMIFWYKDVSVESLITYLTNRCRYAGYGNMEYEKKGNNHVIALQHRLGNKWSIYLHHLMDTVLRKKLGIVARFEVTETIVIVHFTS